jgi:hypothetical protein
MAANQIDISDIVIDIPDKLVELFDGNADYRGVYGGRGSGKTFTIAKILAYYGAINKLRIVCGREIQQTITDSVFFEIKNAIETCPYLTQEYEVGKTYIRSNSGTEFLFKGLRHNISEIKGLGQIDYFWIDEAEAVSEESWRELIPTIRKENSEIWASWNPKDPGSYVQKLFATENSGVDQAIKKSVQVNWRDNPWFPEKLNRERLRSLAEDEEEVYQHIWEGAFLIITGRTVFDKKLTATAIKECWTPKSRRILENTRWIERKDGELRVWAAPEQGKRYCIGADVAEGLLSGDYSSAMVREVTTGEQVAEWHGHIAPDLFGKILLQLGKWYNNAYLGVENNNHGLATLIYLRDTGYPMLYVQRKVDDAYSGDVEGAKLGFSTNSKTKPYIIDQLSAELRDNTHGICSKELVQEMQTYVIDEQGRYGAATGCYDDRVMAYAICGEMVRMSPLYRKKKA